MKLGILIDTGATSYIKELKDTNIDLIPLHATVPNEDDVLDTPAEFEKKKILSRVGEGEQIKTSQASPGELEAKYDELLTKYDHVFHIPITANLSSMLQTSFMVASDEKYNGRVTVYNNERLAAQAIRELAFIIDRKNTEGKIQKIEDIYPIIEEFEKVLYIGLIPGDLKKLASSGRTKSFIASALNLLKTKVLIKWDKKPEKEAIGRTYNALIEKVSETVKKLVDGKENEFKFIFLRSSLTSTKTYLTVKHILEENKIKFVEELAPNIYIVHAGIETIAFILTKKI